FSPYSRLKLNALHTVLNSSILFSNVVIFNLLFSSKIAKLLFYMENWRLGVFSYLTFPFAM
ncbi:MAG: hypothetical protein U0L88_13405, partial [Acutalibacteraceae bacterium]|nr:hypothetical protein [Acutalibacteraceae bacterium]